MRPRPLLLSLPALVVAGLALSAGPTAPVFDVRDFSILNGGHFAILATGVDNLTIDSLTIDTNRDGIDLDACRHVRGLSGHDSPGLPGTRRDPVEKKEPTP